MPNIKTRIEHFLRGVGRIREGVMSKSIVYVLTNEAMPGYVKVGITNDLPLLNGSVQMLVDWWLRRQRDHG